MQETRIVSREEWLLARRALLTKEKAFTRKRDALSAERQRMPAVRIEKEYIFEGPAGPTCLRDLFGSHPQLIVYHFMFDPAWEEGCKSCSFFADNFSGAIAHLAAANTAFAVISRASIEKIEPFRKRMEWSFPWLSSLHNDFKHDFHVTVEDRNSVYNYLDAATLRATGKIWFDKGELPGLSVFLRNGDDILHTYSTYQRGLDIFLNTYNYLDVTPLGRQEVRPMEWVRHHDRYAAAR